MPVTPLLQVGLWRCNMAQTASGARWNGGRASATTGKVIVGVAQEQVQNSSTTAGKASVVVRKGVFKLANTGVAQSNVGADAYALDDQTVGISSTGRSKAGAIVGFAGNNIVWLD